MANINELRAQAEHYRTLYRMGAVDVAKAKEMINPYIEAVNEKSKQLAKQYNVKPKFVSFGGYCR